MPPGYFALWTKIRLFIYTISSGLLREGKRIGDAALIKRIPVDITCQTTQGSAC